jgi:anti-sigma factor RsiW
LIGGRLDVVGGIPVPTLVYGHRKHVTSLTAVGARRFSAGPERD